ncbi:MAG: nucleotidyltransferase domain-containing protein [Bacteroidota bacterium]
MLDPNWKEIVIGTLKPYKPERIGIFGSYARGVNKVGSDLDILVSLQKKVGLLKLIELEQSISDKLGVEVDLLTENGLKNEHLKASIQKDVVTIFHE